MRAARTDWIDRKQRKKMLFILCVFVLLLQGCNKSDIGDADVPQISITQYQKDIYETTVVQKKTIEPKLILTLTPDEYEVHSYMIKQDFLEVENCYAEEGKRVEAGEVMVTFKNDGLEKEIKDYEQRKTENQLLIDHYTKLQKIDKKLDYSKDIKKLKADITVVQTYIEEKKALLADYQLVAEKAGIVTDVNEQLLQGYANRNVTLIKVASGSSDYITSTSDDYEFEIGKCYEATCNMAKYELKVVAVAKENGNQKITFEPVSDMNGVTEKDALQLVILKTPITDAICVEEKAIVTVQDTKYAFLLDDKGYRHAVPVTIREVIDGYAIVTDGLNEGEQVTLN